MARQRNLLDESQVNLITSEPEPDKLSLFIGNSPITKMYSIYPVTQF